MISKCWAKVSVRGLLNYFDFSFRLLFTFTCILAMFRHFSFPLTWWCNRSLYREAVSRVCVILYVSFSDYIMCTRNVVFTIPSAYIGSYIYSDVPEMLCSLSDKCLTHMTIYTSLVMAHSLWIQHHISSYYLDAKCDLKKINWYIRIVVRSSVQYFPDRQQWKPDPICCNARCSSTVFHVDSVAWSR